VPERGRPAQNVPRIRVAAMALLGVRSGSLQAEIEAIFEVD
jgi:hypothetical protein